MIEGIMCRLGYIRYAVAEHAAMEIAASNCRDIQQYIKEDFGILKEEGAEAETREHASKSFGLMIRAGGFPELKSY